jgi:hypothetical protein
MTKILMNVPNMDGTAYYRSMPFTRLGMDVVYHDTWKGLTLEEVYDCDVAFFQRPANQIQVRNIEACKKYKIPVVIDYDDWGFEIDADNPAFDFYSRDDKKACMKECLKLADVTIASVEFLKQSLLEIAPTANIVVIPNAVDEKKFKITPAHHDRDKVILLRGGGSHQKDWAKYKDGIIQLMEDFPDYTLAVMGFHPEWLKSIKKIKYYRFSDLITYFETLMQLKPELMIVPLEDNKFNRCKTDIALIEGTIAGATVISAKLPEFSKYSELLTFETNDELGALGSIMLNNKKASQGYYKEFLSQIPKLSDVNEKRRDIIEQISAKSFYHPNTPELKPATSLEFHEYALSRGHTQDDPEYKKSMERAVDFLCEKTNPKGVFEIGFGTGAALLEFLKRGVMAYGVETNPHSFQYFIERYPMYINQVKCEDVTKEGINVSGEVMDLVYAIEVFEHIDMADWWWDDFLTKLSRQFRYFYFSSTPFSDSKAFDQFWGHSNIRRTTDWIKLFEKNGWKFEKQPFLLTDWDVLFVSKNV